MSSESKHPVKVTVSCLGPSRPLQIKFLFLIKKKLEPEVERSSLLSCSHILCYKETFGLLAFIKITSTFSDMLFLKFK